MVSHIPFTDPTHHNVRDGILRNRVESLQENDVNWYYRTMSSTCLTGPLHGQLFACACRPLTNRRAAWRLSTFLAALRLVSERQVQAKGCSCTGPVRNVKKSLYIRNFDSSGRLMESLCNVSLGHCAFVQCSWSACTTVSKYFP